MAAHLLSEFLGGYQRGIEVAVAGARADELLGVREAFRRYFHDGIDRSVPVAVVPHEEERKLRGIAGSDAEAIEAARAATEALAARLGTTYQFYVATEVAVQPIELGPASRYFLRCWAAVLGPPGAACGASGSIELPERLVTGLEPGDVAASLPATRRSGGLLSSLTGGLETRRSAVALATLGALSTLFFGIFESRPPRR
jgi:hypothetical protein